MERISYQITKGLHTIHGLNFYLSFFDDIAKLIPRDHYCFIVGGWVRDRIIGISVSNRIDVDLLVTCDPGDIAKKFAECIGGKLFAYEKKGIIIKRPLMYTVIFEEGNYRYRFDFSQLKGKNVEKALMEDLLDRDFTANAIALSIDDVLSVGAKQTILYDPTGGIGDLEKGILRPVSIENLRKDPVRILRGFRISAEAELSLSEDFLEFVKRERRLLIKAPMEKVTHEMLKIFNLKGASTILKNMYKLGVLQVIFPEVSKWECIKDQGDHHIYPLDEHSFKTLEYLERIIDRKSYLEPHIYDELGKRKFLGEFEDLVALKISALFHDIGKPDTYNIDNGKITFHGHDKIGSEIINKIGKRLKWGEDLTRFVRSLVKYHLRIFYLRESLVKGQLTDKGRGKFWKECSDIAYYLFILSMADALASGDSEREIKTLIHTINDLCKYKEKRMGNGKAKTLLNGKEIMELCGIGEGPLVGRIKSMLEEAQLEGKVKTKEEAINFVKQLKNE